MLPARNEATTIGPIVSAICQDLVEDIGLVDDIVVIDDGSTDHTGCRAKAAGATVLRAQDVLAAVAGPGPGKGQALWRGTYAACGEILVYLDADIRGFRSHFVVGLLGPLLEDGGQFQFVKACYRRPMADGIGRGGRVTELVARPLLARYFPELSAFAQPLAGEFAGTRQLLESVPFARGYGVDLALLIDVARAVTPARIAQVDLGERIHRNRPLEALVPQAAAVLDVALRRAGGAPRAANHDHAEPELARLDSLR